MCFLYMFNRRQAEYTDEGSTKVVRGAAPMLDTIGERCEWSKECQIIMCLMYTTSKHIHRKEAHLPVCVSDYVGICVGLRLRVCTQALYLDILYSASQSMSLSEALLTTGIDNVGVYT